MEHNVVTVCHLYQVYSVGYHRPQRYLGRQQAEQGQQSGVSAKIVKLVSMRLLGVILGLLMGWAAVVCAVLFLKCCWLRPVYRAIHGVANVLGKAAACAGEQGGVQRRM